MLARVDPRRCPIRVLSTHPRKLLDSLNYSSTRSYEEQHDQGMPAVLFRDRNIAEGSPRPPCRGPSPRAGRGAHRRFKVGAEQLYAAPPEQRLVGVLQDGGRPVVHCWLWAPCRTLRRSSRAGPRSAARHHHSARTTWPCIRTGPALLTPAPPKVMNVDAPVMSRPKKVGITVGSSAFRAVALSNPARRVDLAFIWTVNPRWRKQGLGDRRRGQGIALVRDPDRRS
jgi:hypothetical protein